MLSYWGSGKVTEVLKECTEMLGSGGHETYFPTLLRIQAGCKWRSASFRCRLPIRLNDVVWMGCIFTIFVYGEKSSCEFLWCSLKRTGNMCSFCKQSCENVAFSLMLTFTYSYLKWPLPMNFLIQNVQISCILYCYVSSPCYLLDWITFTQWFSTVSNRPVKQQ
jgi:hypothetical protein